MKKKYIVHKTKIDNKFHLVLFKVGKEKKTLNGTEVSMKLIGQVSPEATWVKDRDLFSKDEFRVMGENAWGELHPISYYKKKTEITGPWENDWGKWKPNPISLKEKDKPKIFVEIKGPCGHFH